MYDGLYRKRSSSEFLDGDNMVEYSNYDDHRRVLYPQGDQTDLKAIVAIHNNELEHVS